MVTDGRARAARHTGRRERGGEIAHSSAASACVRACGRGRTLGKKKPVISWTLRPLWLWARQVRADTYGAAYGPARPCSRRRFRLPPPKHGTGAEDLGAAAYGHRRLNGVVERHQRGTRRQELATSRRRGTSRAQRSDLRPGVSATGEITCQATTKALKRKTA